MEIEPGPRSLFAKSANGFAVLEIDRGKLEFVFIDAAGTELYRYELKPFAAPDTITP